MTHPADDATAGYSSYDVDRNGIAHTVYVTGDGSPVLVMHELPGMTPATLGFGRRLAARGFRIYMPLLFGDAGRSDVPGNYRRLCISREFGRLAAGVSAPVVDWLRALAVDISRMHGGAPVGAIGMCLTGGFVFPLMLEPCVVAPVAAQPGTPFSVTFRAIGIGRGPWMSQLNISDTDLEGAAARARRENITVLAARFETDRICPAERLDRLQRVFGAQLIRRELPGGSAWRTITGPPHATLTEEYERAPDRPDEPTRRLFEEVVSFLKERQGARADAGSVSLDA